MNLHRHLVTVIFSVLTCWVTPAISVGVPGQGTWQTTLQPRDANRDGIIDSFYDTVLNITWANLTGNYSSANAPLTTYPGDGDIITPGGPHTWRLPKVTDLTGQGCPLGLIFGGQACGYNPIIASGSTIYNELAHLYYVTLGNIALLNTSGNVNPFARLNTGPFTTLVEVSYWQGLEPWAFSFGGGFQGSRANLAVSWPVVSGDVAAPIPEPSTAVLTIAGLFIVLTKLRKFR